MIICKYVYGPDTAGRTAAPVLRQWPDEKAAREDTTTRFGTVPTLIAVEVYEAVAIVRLKRLTGVAEEKLIIPESPTA